MDPFGFGYGEGLNGDTYCEDIDYNEGINFHKKPFIRDSLFYHRPLFKDENYKIVRKTEKAILFEDEGGRFWVPKKLLHQAFTTWMVHKIYTKVYIEDK